MSKKQRLAGVDLFRGAAVYAVAILHSGDGSLATTGWEAKTIEFSRFAVPFFLATSFYFMMNKLYTSGFKYSLRSRFTHLCMPYIFWSIVYLLYRGIKYWISHKPEQLEQMLQDPISIVFLGGAAYPLYFIPLLLTGTSLVKLAEFLVKKQINIKSLFLFLILSFIIYELVLTSGNSFQIGPNIAFESLLKLTLPDGNKNPLLRLMLVELSWLIKCLPYIFIAMLLNYPSIKKVFLRFNISSTIFLLAMFLVVNAFGKAILPESVYEVTRGYSALLFAISLSMELKENSIVTNLGLCSFGIYLIHLLVIETFKAIENRVFPETMTHISIFSLLAFSTVGFLVSWMTICLILIMRKKMISKLVLGI